MNARHSITHTLSILNSLGRRSVRFLYAQLIEPRATGEDSRRHEFILNIILVGFIGLVTVLDLFILISLFKYGSTRYSTPFFAFSIFAACFVAFLALSRKGHPRLATYLFLGLYFLSTAYSVFVWGVELPLATLNFVVIIIISSIVVSTRFSFWVTGVIGTLLIGLGYMQVHGITSPDVAWKSIPIILHDPIEITVTFFLIVILTWLSNREIDSSLKRARTSEHDLKIERDNLEIKIEERTKELKETQLEKVANLYRMAEFGRLSSGLFHDLMNPLNAVIANVDQLKEHPDNVDEVKHYLDKAVFASRRMNNFIEAIRKQIQPHEFDQTFSLNKELREAIDVVRFRARIAGVVVSMKESKELFTFGNPLKFHQIVLNLLVNAIDACEGHSSTEPCIVHIKLSKFEGRVQLKVTDHGCGIPEHVIGKVFDPFFTTKSQYKGMGLGLSTTKSIVEKDFGGTISVSSIEGQGTSFTVTFPLKKQLTPDANPLLK